MIQPRGLRHEQAAQYLGLSKRTFDARVQSGELPKPVLIGHTKVWDRAALDRVFDAGSDRTNSPVTQGWVSIPAGAGWDDIDGHDRD